MTGWILFALHIILDVAIIWYVREMLIRFNIISQGFEDITSVLEDYTEHVKNISEMEAYFGDETIMNLLRHSIDTKEYLEEYRTLFSLEDERDLEDAED
jgi:hypothetical protein